MSRCVLAYGPTLDVFLLHALYIVLHQAETYVVRSSGREMSVLYEVSPVFVLLLMAFYNF
jgi:hypothetical protein